MNMNRVILLGNLTREPELRKTSRGTDVCAVGLALNRVFTDAEGGKQEQTSFIDVEAWGRRAELISDHLHKGDPLLVEGRLKQDRWQDEEGQNRSKVKVVVENFQFIGGRAPREQSDAVLRKHRSSATVHRDRSS